MIATKASIMPIRRRLITALGMTFAATLVGPALPDLALDTRFADAVVHLTDTASWRLMPFLCIVLVAVIIVRPGIGSRRRAIEGGAILLAMLITLAGNAVLNEYAVKPLFGVERPNIVALAESGALGPEFPDAASFYAVGDKEARREILRAILPSVATPSLSPTVRDHWIHETGYAFPSGHTTAAMTLTAMLAALGSTWLEGWRRLVMTVVVPVWAVAVSYTRTLLGVHYPIDVAVGALAGFAWGLLAFFVIRRAVTALLRTEPHDGADPSAESSPLPPPP
jgi:phosphatidylglycerophosphatase B